MFKFVQAVKAAVMAVGISVVCLLPPIVHFVTGPLGPAIGGYFAGNRMRLTAGQAALVGLILGTVEGVLTPFLFVRINLIPDFSTPILMFFGGFVAIYVMALSGVAAWVGGNSAREDEMAEGSE
ncbi:MAG TPA: hypothetical protein VHV31_05715 [Nitrolancea sp.]|nr:hypothetical protein [Nitrolancea sp.]